jgi:hypothetical protein
LARPSPLDVHGGRSRLRYLHPREDDWNERISDAETTTLATILSGGLKEFSYLYDFGDSWQHRIIVENVKPAEQQNATGMVDLTIPMTSMNSGSSST